MEHQTTEFAVVNESSLLAAEELDAIEEDLNEELQLALQLTYSNPKHVARIVFEILHIRPRATAGVLPPYGGSWAPSSPPKVRPRSLARLQARRGGRRELTRRATSIDAPLSSRRVTPIDFDAELPDLPFVDVAPAELPLEQLVFYRDEHPLIPKLCRYQALWRQRLASATPERYQQ